MKIISAHKSYIIIRVTLGIVFIWASVDKIINPEQFAEMIYNYKLVPSIIINSMATILPWLELFTGTALIIGFWERGALLIFNSLIIIFMVALTSALIRGLDIQCGCFTVDPNADREIMNSLIRDFFMIIAGIWGLIKATQNHPKQVGCQL